jgi:hypothetical protein
MKTATRMAAQGDVLFRRVGGVPPAAKKHAHDGTVIVAHSETGHHHVIVSRDVDLYSTDDPLISVLHLKCAFADVQHLRSHDTHETLRLFGSESEDTYFEVRRQREYTEPSPEPWNKVVD